jgi:proliferating cell nuclear antigen
MEFRISDKKKKDVFISIFGLLKNSSSQINLTIHKDIFHIQGMDKSHVCLFDLSLHQEWFDYFQVDKKYEICFDSIVFYSIISIKSDDQMLVFKIDDISEDVMNIQVVQADISVNDKKGDYNKYFTLPLIEYEYEKLNIPSTEYDAELSLTSKKITDMLSQLINFGQDLVIHCTNEWVDFKTSGDSANMRVNIPIDDLNTYSIVEDEEVKLNYNLNYISKMCITNKLSADIELCLSNECPMKITYDLGHKSSLAFYIAPKTADD